ncbi:MAG: hypothetical protein ACUVRX_10065 [Actinomycetota bacterium]
MFSRLASLIAGLLVALLAVIMLAARQKWPASLTLIFCLPSVNIAVANPSSILRNPVGEGLVSAGAGIYTFALFSLLGLVSSAVTLSG